MRKCNVTISIILSFLIAAAALAQVRGTGRIQGVVTDKATGKPVEGATVTIVPARQQTQPINARTDSRGRWAALGLTDGTWNIDIAAKGYETGRGTAVVSELQMAPPIKTVLTPSANQEEPAAIAGTTTADAAPLIPREGVDAIREGQDLLKIKAGDIVTTSETTTAGASTALPHTVTADEVKENSRRAVADFERALPMIPENQPEAKTIRTQLLQVMAQAYYRAGDAGKAIATLEQLSAADAAAPAGPAATQQSLLLVNLYLEHGDLDKAKSALQRLPAGAVTDPTVYTNIGILFLNKQNPGDASTYFSKAVDLDPKRAESYYYRGMAETQLKKNKEARADFQQVLTLSPGSPEAQEAKQMLDAMAAMR